MTKINYVDLGSIEYQKALELQRNFLQDLILKKAPETIYICEHFPVITHGRAANLENILVPADLLLARGISILEVERGGDVTWHGPGQIVAYPMLDLRTRKQDVAWYLRKLENVVIKLLDKYNIKAQRICNKTGVWIEDRKIASIGVKLSRWCTMHGLSLNYLNCQKGFSTIRACGLPDLKVTSIIEEQPGIQHDFLTHEKLAKDLQDCFELEFNEEYEQEKKHQGQKRNS